MYNTTNITAANNLLEIGSSVNELSGGYFFPLAMLILFIVYLAVFKKQEFKNVLLIASFSMSVISIIMFILGYVGYQFIIIPLLIFFASLIIYYFVQKN